MVQLPGKRGGRGDLQRARMEVDAPRREGSAMAEPKDGCVKPAGGVLGIPATKPEATSSSAPAAGEEVRKVLARVGHPAPDFEVNAYVDGGFKNVKLSDYKGKWTVICFYPGDFTFV
jgi:hypothetical protein